MLLRREKDEIYRQIYQNIWGIHNNDVETTYEIEAINRLGANIAGYQESNKPWILTDKHKYAMFREAIFGQMEQCK